MEVFLMNLGNGKKGEWLSLPVSKGMEIESFIQKNEISTPMYEEYIIADTNFDSELELTIGEFDNVFELNELLKQYELLGQHDKNIVLALIQSNGNRVDDFQLALSSYDNYSLAEDICCEYRLGEYIIADELYELRDKIPSYLFSYIDFEAIGKKAVENGDIAITSFGALY